MNQRTPAGGDRSEIIYLDDQGNHLTSPEGATQVEITEYAEDIPIKRTYGTLPPVDTPAADQTTGPATEN